MLTELGQEIAHTARSQGWLLAITATYVLTCPPSPVNRERATNRWPLEWWTDQEQEGQLRLVLLYLMVQGMEWEDDPRSGGPGHLN